MRLMDMGLVAALVATLVAVRVCDRPVADKPPPPVRPDTLVIYDSLKVSRVDTVRIEAEFPCRNWSINRASYTCR